MKTSLDSFLSLTSPENILSPLSRPLAIQEASDAQALTLLPEDVLLRIFSFLSTSTLCQIGSVSKTFSKLSSSDIIWQAIAQTIFIPSEIAAKSQATAYKDFCKESLTLTKLENSDVVWQPLAKSLQPLAEFLPISVIPSQSQNKTSKDSCQDILKALFANIPEDFNIFKDANDKLLTEMNEMNKPSDSYLKPRDPIFINKIKQMQLPEYKILTPSETLALCRKKDTASLIQAIISDLNISYFHFHHVAHQQLGTINFDFLNCTDYVISFNSDRFLMINNKLTKIHFNAAPCQLLIYADPENLWIYDSDLEREHIEIMSLLIKDLMLDDYTQIKWEHKRSISKFLFADVPL